MRRSSASTRSRRSAAASRASAGRHLPDSSASGASRTSGGTAASERFQLDRISGGPGSASRRRARRRRSTRAPRPCGGLELAARHAGDRSTAPVTWVTPSRRRARRRPQRWIRPSSVASPSPDRPPPGRRRSLGGDVDRGLLRGPGAEVEADRAGEPRDLLVLQPPASRSPLEPVVVGAARAHRADVRDLGQRRSATSSRGRRTSGRGWDGDDRVGVDAAGPPRGPGSGGASPRRPVGLGEPGGGGEDRPGVAHRDVVAQKLPTFATAAAKSIAPNTSIRGLGRSPHEDARMPPRAARRRVRRSGRVVAGREQAQGVVADRVVGAGGAGVWGWRSGPRADSP